jgi:branched-chain amino acid transport system ATP-binding protein
MSESTHPVADDTILRLKNLRKSFAGFDAVSNVSLDVRRGSIHALIGPNGAGKTTLFNLATRFLAPTSGTIWFNGRDITRLAPSAVARLGMVRSFQISAVFLSLTARENVRIALQTSRDDAFAFWRHKRVLNSLDDRADALLADVGLADLRHRPVSELAYGQRRALELATTLALDPALLLLDEPTAGMGREDVARTATLIRRVAAKRTVLMVEHNLSVVSDLSDRITVLARGEILADGTYAEVSRDPAVITAYMGTQHAPATGASHG